MRRFPDKIAAAKALMPAARQVIRLIEGTEGEFVRSLVHTCPACRSGAAFVFRRLHLRECAECFAVISSDDLFGPPLLQ